MFYWFNTVGKIIQFIYHSDLPEEHESNNQGKRYINSRKKIKGVNDTGHRCYRICCFHYSVYDPWLSANLCNRPAGFDSNKAHRRSKYKQPEQPAAVAPT